MCAKTSDFFITICLDETRGWVQIRRDMKIQITKFNSRTWEWEIVAADGTHLRGGHSRTKADAINDSGIVLGWLQ